MSKPNLSVNGVDLSKIRNRNEARVVKHMPDILEREFADFIFDSLDVEDIYALTLNLLPARYAQTGTIILQKEPSDEELVDIIREAVEKVLDNPTRSDRD